MMTALLVIAGAAIAFGIGWLAGRSSRSGGEGVESSAPVEPVPPVTATELSWADLIEDHPTGIVVAGPDGTVSFRNAAARGMRGTHVGVLLDEAIEHHIAAVCEGESSDDVLEMYGPPSAVFVVAARPTPDGGVVVFIDDVSERRRVERARTDFVANISHELKTPVGAMLVLAETLEGETDPETIARMLTRMMSEAERASNTLDNLMELSMIESGAEHDVEPVCVADVIRASVERVTELANRDRIRIVSTDTAGVGAVDAAEPAGGTIVVEGNRRQLVSAVGNLLENAVKYSEPGGTVQIRVDRHTDSVEIAVIDHGVGIPQRDLDRVFERFYRVDPARSRGTGGTGLGLSIVRHVATRHRGEVSVSSSEGEGSTFTLRLPVQPQIQGDTPGSITAPSS
jgi:two-component system sensor histidine kinase SenX3